MSGRSRGALVRGLIALTGLVVAGPAHAVDVVWFSPPVDGALTARVESAAGGRADMLEPLDLLGASGDALREDRRRHDGLEQTLQDVRTYEAKLDGELLIMDDLQRALDDVVLIDGEQDQDRVFRALAYQGFAVHRFFEGVLDSDERAQSWRLVYNDVAYVGPWAQAMALDPQRELTAYEVAESPQRIAYAKQRAMLGEELLPGTLDLQADGWVERGATVVVDGMERSEDDLKLLPGTHWVHLELEGHILDSGRVQIEPGRTTRWSPAHNPVRWTGWIEAVRDGGTPTPDEALAADVQALGGEVWFVVGQGSDAVVHALSVSDSGAATWREVPLVVKASDGRPKGLSIAAGVGADWLYSGDFYAQDPGTVPRTVGAVNAAGVDVDLQVAYDMGPLRLAVGGNATLPTGEHHVALTGEDGRLRLRPVAYVAAGIPLAQALVGYLWPYHPVVGAQVQVPIWKGLEIRGRGLLGLPGEQQRKDGNPYDRQSLSLFQIGASWRIRFE